MILAVLRRFFWATGIVCGSVGPPEPLCSVLTTLATHHKPHSG
jgi:hypothetical protein